jgi:hypothetical protein
MKNYKVEVFESLAKVIDIKADNPEAALETIKEMYKNEEIVLDSSDFASVDFNLV